MRTDEQFKRAGDWDTALMILLYYFSGASPLLSEMNKEKVRWIKEKVGVETTDVGNAPFMSISCVWQVCM